MRFVKTGILATFTLLLFTYTALAQTNSASNGSVTAPDRHFMDKAAQGGMAEVELGQLAEQNGQSQAVKDFGQRMVNDHSKANDELKQLASQKGVSLPTTLDAKDQATKQHLSNLKGEAFDRAYMNDMVKDHKADVAEFKHESMAAHDPQLKEWVSKTLPTLESHLQEAEKIAPSTGAMAQRSSDMNKGAGGVSQPQ